MPPKPRRNNSLLFTTIHKHYLSCDLVQPALDLFGDVVITDDDIFLWVSVVAPRWLYSERAFMNYVRGWSVSDKIRTAKIDRSFDKMTVSASRMRPWHERLAIDMILPTH